MCAFHEADFLGPQSSLSSYVAHKKSLHLIYSPHTTHTRTCTTHISPLNRTWSILYDHMQSFDNSSPSTTRMCSCTYTTHGSPRNWRHLLSSLVKYSFAKYSKFPPIMSRCRPHDGSETDTADLTSGARHSYHSWTYLYDPIERSKLVASALLVGACAAAHQARRTCRSYNRLRSA